MLTELMSIEETVNEIVYVNGSSTVGYTVALGIDTVILSETYKK